jgi:hypothetical protein
VLLLRQHAPYPVRDGSGVRGRAEACPTAAHVMIDGVR